MLRRIPEPIALSEASLLAFRPALNTPVLNVEFMPVGPARAAIAVFTEDWGGIGLALGIRSIEGGQVAVYRNRESLQEGAQVSEIFKPALAAAERLGFLFDEDILEGTSGDQGRSQATALWGQLMGAAEVEVTAASAAVRPHETPAPDLNGMTLNLDQPLPPEPELAAASGAVTPQETPTPAANETTLDLDEPLGAEPELAEVAPEDVAVDPPVQPVLPPQTLSRFSHAEVADEKSGPLAAAQPDRPDKKKGGASQLGRIPLVRARKGRDGRRAPFNARLLSIF
jgi:hypothetical protein